MKPDEPELADLAVRFPRWEAWAGTAIRLRPS